MKKVLWLLIFSIVVITGCSLKNLKERIEQTIENHPTDGVSIMNFDKYKGFDINNVSSLSIIKYREYGMDEGKIDDIGQIKNEFNIISQYKVLNESNSSCDDNTTIYEFNMKNGSKVSFEFECDWIVIDNKRYEIERG